MSELKVVKNPKGVSTLVFSDESCIFRVKEDNFNVIIRKSDLIVRENRAKIEFRLAFGTVKSAKAAFSALKLPVDQMEEAWPSKVIAASSGGSSAKDTEVENIATMLDALSVADENKDTVPILAVHHDLLRNPITSSFAVTDFVKAWAETRKRANLKMTAPEDVVSQIEFFDFGANGLEHDKITKTIEIMTRRFKSPCCKSGSNYEYEIVKEKPGWVFNGGNPLTGRIDCVLVDRITNRFVVLEVKTKQNHNHVPHLWVESVVQARLCALMLKDQLKLDYVPDAYVFSTVLFGDALNRHGKIISGGRYVLALWKILKMENMVTYEDACKFSY